MPLFRSSCGCMMDPSAFATSQARCASCEQLLFAGQHLVPAPRSDNRPGSLVVVCRGCWLLQHLLAGLRSSPPGSEARGVIEGELSKAYEVVFESLAAQALARTESSARSHAWTGAAPARTSSPGRPGRVGRSQPGRSQPRDAAGMRRTRSASRRAESSRSSLDRRRPSRSRCRSRTVERR